jgi:hypothetical protein
MPLNELDKDGFLQLWRGLLPEGYTQPIEASESGLDIPASHAAIWARVERALNRSQGAYYLRPHSTQTAPIASGGTKSTGEVLLRRAAPALGAIVVPVGTILEAVVTDSFGGELLLGRFLTTEEATIPEGSLGPVAVDVEAEFVGFTGDVAAGSIVRFTALGRREVPALVDTTTRLRRSVPAYDQRDRFDDALVGRYVRLVGGALSADNARVPRRVEATYVAVDGQLGIEVDLALDPGDVGAVTTVEVEELADLGVTVEQPAATEGGTPDSLGAIGAERRIGKRPGETDEEFRARFATLADTISPAAHIRILDRILGSAGIPYHYLETRAVDELMGFTWDVHPYDFGQVCPPITKTIGSEYVGQGGVWLQPGTLTRFSVICVDPGSLGDFGFAYDTVVPLPGAPNAWDVGFFDGSALGVASVLGRVWDEINAARAAGVGFLIIKDGEI